MYGYALVALPAWSMVSMLRAGFDPYTASKSAGVMFLLLSMFGGVFTKVTQYIMRYHMHELDAYEMYRLLFLYWY